MYRQTREEVTIGWSALAVNTLQPQFASNDSLTGHRAISLPRMGIEDDCIPAPSVIDLLMPVVSACEASY